MNASILRAVLALALLLGTGVVVNVLSNGAKMTSAGNAAVSSPAAELTAPPTLVAERERVRLREAVERELIGRGYLAQMPDNGAGVTARAAILAFEFDHSLPLTALPSDDVLKALIFTHAKTSAQRPSAPATDAATSLIEEVQRALAHLGYGEDKITARLDKPTQRAIRQFERARGLEPSGRISAPLIESLGPAFNAKRIEGGTAQAGKAAAG